MHEEDAPRQPRHYLNAVNDVRHATGQGNYCFEKFHNRKVVHAADYYLMVPVHMAGVVVC